MLQYLVICSAAFITSVLTLLSGFGLGTLLLPAFVIFFHIEIAVALTAVVHFLNNLFKLGLLGKYADKRTVIAFGLPAILSAFVGAWSLLWFSDLAPVAHYRLLGHEFSVLPVKLVVAILMVAFALMEINPNLERISFSKKYLPLGGLLSGFFGGLSGHQGALRSAFLIRAGLSKERYLGTGIVIACLVDISRISVYGARFSSVNFADTGPVLVAAAVSAFIGAVIGNRLMKKITLRSIQILVSVLLFVIALGLAAGLV
jgi:uncharacterized membrane protein YfcA